MSDSSEELSTGVFLLLEGTLGAEVFLFLPDRLLVMLEVKRSAKT